MYSEGHKSYDGGGASSETRHGPVSEEEERLGRVLDAIDDAMSDGEFELAHVLGDEYLGGFDPAVIESVRMKRKPNHPWPPKTS